MDSNPVMHKDDIFADRLKNKYGQLATDVVDLLLNEAIEQKNMDRIQYWHGIKRRL